MAELMEHVQVLTDEIGPRPVSTEEEHQASLYVAQNLQDAGLEVNIDEFATPTGVRWPYALSFGLIILGTVLSGLGKFVPGLSTTFFAIGLLLVAAALVFFFTERFNRPILSKALCRGVSQNVVARYVPSSVARERRRRKVVVVAHLDTVRAQPEAMPAVVNALPILKKAAYFCMIGLGAAFLIRMLPFPWPETVDFVLWIVSLVACVFLLLWVICIAANRFTPYVSGANDNASSIAVMLGLARRLLDPAERERFAKETAAKKEAREAEAAAAAMPPVETFQPEQPAGTFDPEQESYEPASAPEPVIHGEDEARAAGLVPEGVELEYAADAAVAMPALAEEPAPSQDEPEAEEAAPVEDGLEAEAAEEEPAAPAVELPVAEAVAPVAALAAAAEAAAVAAAEPAAAPVSPSDEVDPGLPSWYTAAKRKAAASEPADEAEPELRSRYASMPTTREQARAMQAQRRAEEDEAAQLAAPEPVEVEPVVEHIQGRSVDDILVDLGVDPQEIPSSAPLFEVPALEEAPAPSFSFADAQPEPAAPARDNVISLAAFKGQLAEADVEDLEPSIEGGFEEGDVIDELTAANRAGLTGRIPVIGAESAEADGFATYAAVDAGATGLVAADAEEPVEPVDSDDAPEQEQPLSAGLTGSFKALQARRAAAKEAKAAQQAAQPKRNAKPTARRAGSDFVPTKAADAHSDAAQMLSASYQAAAVDSEFHDTIQAAPQQPAFDPFAPKGDPAANASLINPSVSTAFPAVSPALSTEFPAVGDYSAAPGSTSSFPSLTGTFPSIGSSNAAGDPFGQASASDFGDAGDAFNGFAPNMDAQIDAPASRMHGFMDKVGGVFGKLGRKKKDQDQDFNDGWVDDDNGWKGGAYFDQDRASSHEAVRARAAQIKEAVVCMTESDLLDKEVWFVALGASGAGNKGMKNFLELHKSELRGALIINLEGVGAGDICFVDYEGTSKARRSDRRLQSLVRKASKELDGTEMSAERLNWRDTDATPALEAGMRAMTIMGFDGVAPTGWHWTTDYTGIIEEEKLEYVTSVLMKMIENS
ncbi:MAG: M28 family peptidase [Coriobacteriales bacterium]